MQSDSRHGAETPTSSNDQCTIDGNSANLQNDSDYAVQQTNFSRTENKSKSCLRTKVSVELSKKEFSFGGRRIVDLDKLLLFLKDFSDHPSMANCGINHLEILSEYKQGLNSLIKIKCQMCNYSSQFNTCELRRCHL